MAVDPDLFFKLMQSADRNNLINKGSAIMGEIIERVISDPGIDLGDLFNIIDNVSMDALLKVDKIVGMANPLLRLAANDYLMRTASRILDSATLNRFAVDKGSVLMIRMLKGEKGTGFISRLRETAVAKLNP